MRLRRLVVAAATLASGLAAHATPFTLNATFADNATITGTVDINTVTGLYTQATVAYSLNGSTTTINAPANAQTGPILNPPGFYIPLITVSFGNPSNLLFFTVEQATLIGYTGSSICDPPTYYCAIRPDLFNNPARSSCSSRVYLAPSAQNGAASHRA